MAQNFDIILHGGVLVNQDGETRRDVGVRDGAIAEIGDLSHASAGEKIACHGLHILPGVIDTQCIFVSRGCRIRKILNQGREARF